METGTFELEATSAHAVSAARHALHACLREWGCRNAEDVLLVFSELVTNAVRHGGGAHRIVVQHTDHIVTLTVYDAGDQPPEIHTPQDGLGGFGLKIVDQLATSWGWTPTAAGKHVWAELACFD